MLFLIATAWQAMLGQLAYGRTVEEYPNKVLKLRTACSTQYPANSLIVAQSLTKLLTQGPHLAPSAHHRVSATPGGPIMPPPYCPPQQKAF